MIKIPRKSINKRAFIRLLFFFRNRKSLDMHIYIIFEIINANIILQSTRHVIIKLKCDTKYKNIYTFIMLLLFSWKKHAIQKMKQLFMIFFVVSSTANMLIL